MLNIDENAAVQKLYESLKRTAEEYTGHTLDNANMFKEVAKGIIKVQTKRMFAKTEKEIQICEDDLRALKATNDALIEQCTSVMRQEFTERLKAAARAVADGAVAVAGVIGDAAGKLVVAAAKSAVKSVTKGK